MTSTVMSGPKKPPTNKTVGGGGQQLIMKDKSVSVLATVSVGGSKTLIGAPVSPCCTSAGCHTKMEGIHARCACMFQEAHKRFSSRPLYRARLVVSFPSYYTRHLIMSRDRTLHRKVLHASSAFASRAASEHACGCCPYLCSILASSSSY